MNASTFRRTTSLFTALGVSATLVACATVKRDDFEATVVQLREEIREGDEQVMQRVSEVSQRVDGIDSRVSGLERDLAALQDEFNTTVERLEAAIRFNTPIYFAFDDATLQSQYGPLLDRFASVVSQYYPDALITVEGFTDPAGSQEYNIRLGKERAESVKDYLVNNSSISGDRVRTVSYGKVTERLVRENARGPGQEGWENRRVVLVIDHGEPAAGARPIAALN